MTIITLDLTLPKVEPRKPYEGQASPRNRLLARFLSDGATKYDWKEKTTTETEIVFATSLPEQADHFHYNYLGYLQKTYGLHNPIVLAPHHFWYTILCEIAQEVIRQSELHRPLFTRDPKGKIDIIVPGDETEPLRMDAIYEEMVGLVPVDTKLFLPTFSTSTETSRLAALAAFLETCSPYYNYMMLACGHPAIKLAGTREDWEMVVAHLAWLHDEFLKVGSGVAEWIKVAISPVALKLAEALDGQHADWFRTIFSQTKCGSGSQYVVSGWWSKLFMMPIKGLGEVTNYPTHISKVPYTTMPSGGQWNLCFALTHSNADEDGFMVPDYSWAQIKKLATPRVTQGE